MLKKLMTAAMIALGTSSSALAAEPGQVSPEISLQDSAGQRITLSQLRGAVVVLDFWASWCESCRESMPWLDKLQTRSRSRGLHVLAINLDQDRKAAERFLEANSIPELQVLFDPQGQSAADFELKSLPGTFLIGRDGRIIAVHYRLDRDSQKALAIQANEALLAPSLNDDAN
jgi:thiol-disulfide isomerase/thioredoxin